MYKNEVMKFIVILMIRIFSKNAPHFRKTRIPKPLLMLISLCRYWFTDVWTHDSKSMKHARHTDDITNRGFCNSELAIKLDKVLKYYVASLR